MNRFFKHIIAAVALLCSTGAWAGGVIDIVKTYKKVATTEEVGTVTAEVDATTNLCTVTVMPNEGWYIKSVSAVKKIDAVNAQARKQAPAFDTAITVFPDDETADPSGETTYSFEMPDAVYDVEVTADFERSTSLKNAEITLSNDTFVYDGTAKTPEVDVILNDASLDDQYYDVTYENNTEAGQATVIVTGKYTYTDTISTVFNIVYGLTVNDIQVSRDNMLDVLGDLDPDSTVVYNGQGTLVLKNCQTDLTVVSGLEIDLTVFVKGSGNCLKSITTSNPEDILLITTDPSLPGTLTVGTDGAENPAIVGFSDVQLQNDLVWITGSADAPYGEIGTKMLPVHNEVVPQASDFETSGVTIFNQVINNVLYTYTVLPNDAENGDGFFAGEGDIKPGVILNTYMSEDDVNKALQYEPSTPEFAELFTGITFKIPAGTGKIILNVFVGRQMMVKIGDGEPIAIEAMNGEITIPYATAKITYVYIYNGAVEEARSVGPLHAKIKTTTVKMHALEVAPDEIQHLSDPALAAIPDNMLSDRSKMSFSHGVYRLRDLSVTSLARGIFKGISNARAIDLTETSITGVTVDRDADEFEGVSDDTFIYLPVGNEAAADEKNVVIGVVCNNMELNDGDTEFYAARDFGAVEVTLGRDFVENQTSTVYLPFGISQLTAADMGAFYTFDKIENGQAKLNLVEGDLQANTPYIFMKSAAGKLSIANALIKQLPETPVTSELIGTYEKIEWTQAMLDDYEANNEYIYGYAAADQGEDIKAGEFVRVGAGAFINPYRAYLKVKENAGARLSICWGDEALPTTIRTVNADTARNGWYTLSGIKLSKAPTMPGMYLNNGKKTIINK